MVLAICKFGITYILPNNSWVLRCFRSARLAVYAVHAMCIQCRVSMAITPARGAGRLPRRRFFAGAVSFDAFPGAPLSPSPPGWRKSGAALRRQPMRYDTQPFETSRQTSSHSTHGKRTERVFNNGACVQRVFRVCLPQHVLERVVSGLTGTGASLPSERLAGAKCAVEFAESAGKRICASAVPGRGSQSRFPVMNGCAANRPALCSVVINEFLRGEEETRQGISHIVRDRAFNFCGI